MQVLDRIGDTVGHFANAASIVKREGPTEAERSNNEPATAIESPIVNKTRDHQETEHRRNCPCCARFQQAWARAPAVHPFRMNCGANILTEDGEVFAKIEAIAKLVDSILTFRNLRRRCRRQQPACERSLAGACAGQRK